MSINSPLPNSPAPANLPSSQSLATSVYTNIWNPFGGPDRETGELRGHDRKTTLQRVGRWRRGSTRRRRREERHTQHNTRPTVTRVQTRKLLATSGERPPPGCAELDRRLMNTLRRGEIPPYCTQLPPIHTPAHSECVARMIAILAGGAVFCFCFQLSTNTTQPRADQV